MCQPATCNNCKKTTWKGCGQHIDSVKAKVPDSQWCTCDNRDVNPLSGVISAAKNIFSS